MTTAEKYWNTWSPNSFAAMTHLPTGLKIIPGAFSEAERSYSEFPYDSTTRLWEHDQDGRYCRLTVGHAHALFELEYLKPDPWTVLLRIRNTTPPREWGLRYHLLATLGFAEGDGRMWLGEDGALCGSNGEFCVAAAFDGYPYNITLAETPDAVGVRMADKGFKASWLDALPHAPWATCRFTLEAGPEVRLAVSLANDHRSAKQRAECALDYFSCWEEQKCAVLAGRTHSVSEDYPGAMEAVSDIMAWNDMSSPPLKWEYTSIAKAWNESFGQWYLFFSDACYQVLLKSAVGDPDMAENNLNFVLSASMPAGNFAGLYSGYQKWVDRTQPPVLGFSLLTSYLHTGDLTPLSKALPNLIRAADWYLANRESAGLSLIQLGTSNTGRGDYRRTKVGAKNEAAMDNSPMYDEAVYQEDTGMLDMHDVGISSLLALDLECTARIARILGRMEDAVCLETKAEQMKLAVHDHLWNDAEKIFANRHLDGRFGLTSPTSFYPLAAGIADECQVEASLSHIFDPEEFFTECPMIAINAKSPTAQENKYWRGRSWAPQPFWTYVGLRRAGRDTEAHRLAHAVMKHFYRHWTQERRCYENYNPFTGEGADTVDSNGFYSWTALVPLMWGMEQISIDPWNGLSVGFFDGADCCQKNRLIGGRRVTLNCQSGHTEFFQSGELVFSSNIPTRFKHLVLERHYCSVELNAPIPGYIAFPGKTAIHARINDSDVAADSRFELSAGRTKIELFCR